MMYNKIVHDYFFSPRHVGRVDLAHPLAVGVKNKQKDQGTIELYLQGNFDGTILRACFKTNGNPYVIAGLEWLCRQLEGKKKWPQIDYNLIVNELEMPKIHYPVAIRIMTVYNEVLELMNNSGVTK